MAIKGDSLSTETKYIKEMCLYSMKPVGLQEQEHIPGIY
jgi:hypothetical protein